MKEGAFGRIQISPPPETLFRPSSLVTLSFPPHSHTLPPFLLHLPFSPLKAQALTPLLDLCMRMCLCMLDAHFIDRLRL